MKKILFVMILVASPMSWSCSPSVNFKASSFLEIYNQSEYVFKGILLSNVDQGYSNSPFGIKHKLQFQIQKIFKGARKDKITLTSISNTCDSFGQDAVSGEECIMFSTKDYNVISGLFGGFASVCELPSSLNKLKSFSEREIVINKAM